MKKIWNEQDGSTMYALNESAIHTQVSRKNRVASKRMSLVEITISIINGVAAIILLVDALKNSHMWDYIGSGLLVLSVISIGYFRWRRIRGENTFDRTLLGELNHTLYNTDALMLFNRLMISAYMVPMGIFVLVKMLSEGASLEKWMLISSCFLFSFILIWWERKCLLLPKQKSLISLKRKLLE